MRKPIRHFCYSICLLNLLFISMNLQAISESEMLNQAYQSTYSPDPSPKTIIKNGTVLTGTGLLIERANVLIENNKIIAVGRDIDDDEAQVIDAEGKWVTPGIIDIHSHMGVYPAPSLRSSSDGNEATSPVTPHVWAEHSVWTHDPQYTLALKGGITTFHVLPGSANLIGGRGVTLKNIRSVTVQGMKFPGAPYTLKMACGENPKRVYGNRDSEPSTKMGNVAGYRKAWIEAQSYLNRLEEYESKSEEAKELVKMGADGITTNCGFLSLFQDKMAEAVYVPVATSSLMQVQMVQSLLPKNKKVGILTIHKPSLKEAHLKAANVPLDTPIVGTENGKEFTRVIINDEKEMNIDLARQDHLDAAEELLKKNSNIGAIVMECTNMSPFAADIRKKFEIPVFNIYTFIEWFQSGLLPTRFNSDHDDPRK